jgi:hypothetical protein
MAVVAIGSRDRAAAETPAAAPPIARDAIAAAAAGLGGAERLIDWVNADPANERTFWGTIYPKLLSHQDSPEVDAPAAIDEIRWTVVDGGA